MAIEHIPPDGKRRDYEPLWSKMDASRSQSDYEQLPWIAGALFLVFLGAMLFLAMSGCAAPEPVDRAMIVQDCEGGVVGVWIHDEAGRRLRATMHEDPQSVQIRTQSGELIEYAGPSK